MAESGQIALDGPLPNEFVPAARPCVFQPPNKFRQIADRAEMPRTVESHLAGGE